MLDRRAHFLREFEHFFRVYKDLEDEKRSAVLGWRGREEVAAPLGHPPAHVLVHLGAVQRREVDGVLEALIESTEIPTPESIVEA